MARIVLNPAIQILSGDLGGYVFRKQSDGSMIVAKAPLTDPDREPTEAQAEHQQRFKEAAARYRRLMEQAEIKAAYERLLSGRGSLSRLRAFVMGDILRAPEISTIDLSNYQGQPGDTIRVIAEDSVGVARLALVVYDQTASQALESAEKDLSGQVAGVVEWIYPVTVALPAGHSAEVRVTAYDLAGNEGAKSSD